MKISLQSFGTVESFHTNKPSPSQISNLRQFNNNKTNGELSSKRKSWIQNIIRNFIIGHRYTVEYFHCSLDIRPYFFTLQFPGFVDSSTAKYFFRKFRRKVLNAKHHHLIAVLERSKSGSHHWHCVALSDRKMLETFWTETVETETDYLFACRLIDVQFSREDVLDTANKLANYLTKGTVAGQGKIEGRLYYASNAMRKLSGIEKSGDDAVVWMRQNHRNIKLKDSGEFYNIYTNNDLATLNIDNLFSGLILDEYLPF